MRVSTVHARSSQRSALHHYCILYSILIARRSKNLFGGRNGNGNGNSGSR